VRFCLSTLPIYDNVIQEVNLKVPDCSLGTQPLFPRCSVHHIHIQFGLLYALRLALALLPIFPRSLRYDSAKGVIHRRPRKAVMEEQTPCTSGAQHIKVPINELDDEYLAFWRS